MRKKTAFENFMSKVRYNSKDERCHVDTFKITIEPSGNVLKALWDEDLYKMTREYKIYMNPGRMLSQMYFDFYREIGRIKLHHNTIGCHRADKWFNVNDVVAPNTRESLVIDMTLDEFAAHQLQYLLPLEKLLDYTDMEQMTALYPNELTDKLDKLVTIHNMEIDIRRCYIQWIIRNSKKTNKKPVNLKISHEGEEIMSNAYETKIIETDKKETPSKIQEVMRKMSLNSWTKNFDANIKEMIRVYASPLAELTEDDMILKTESYIPLEDKPEDWETAKDKYFRINDGRYQGMRKMPKFEKGMYYRHIKYDVKDLIEDEYNMYHKIVVSFVVPYYKKYVKTFRSDERNMYQYIITRALSAYIESTIEEPTDIRINNYVAEWENSQRPDIVSSGVGDKTKMMSFNEKKRVIDIIAEKICDKYGILEYEFKEGYLLDKRIQDAAFIYGKDGSGSIDKIEEKVMPFMINRRSF